MSPPLKAASRPNDHKTTKGPSSAPSTKPRAIETEEVGRAENEERDEENGGFVSVEGTLVSDMEE